MPTPQELWNQSAEAWVRRVETGDPNRIHVLDPVMLSWAGEVAGMSVCDVGCGEGRFARMLSERGARVTGIEPTERLLEAALSKDADSNYVLGSAEQMPFAEACFDLVVCYLVLIDIPDFRRAIQEMMRVCRPGGRLLVANLNSFTTSVAAGWAEDEEGKRLYFPVDNYMEERPERVSWCGIDVINYHRPFSAYMQAFLGAGLRLMRFDEPVPAAEVVRANPRMMDNVRVPYFHVMEWLRP